jgi:hypothetical protein
MNRPITLSSFILSAILLGLGAQAVAETTPPQPIDLGSDSNFLVLSGAGIQNLSGSGLLFNGNIGTSPSSGSYITGITQAMVTGKIYCVDAAGPAGSIASPVALSKAKGDMTTAYNDGFGRVLARVTQAPELGGLTLTGGGLYWSATGFNISMGDLTLDAGGVSSRVWIFQAGTAGSPTDVNLASTRNITLTNGALAANVFWVCRSATINTSTTFAGTILAQQTITNAGNGSFEGRQLAFTGGITFNGVANPSMCAPGCTGQSAIAADQSGSYIYPSPTRGDTARIVYTLASPGSIKIRIHDEIGRLMDTITEENLPAGFLSSPVSVGKLGSDFYMLTIKYDNGTTDVQKAHKFAVQH